MGLCACGTGDEEKRETSENKKLDSVRYTIEREDASVKDEDGNYILQAFYDIVVINEEGEVADKINAQIQEAADAFMDEAREQYEFAAEMAPFGRVFKHYAEAEVVTNENGILSIRLTENLYSGGEHEVDTIVGMNFNLQTGEKLTVEEIFDMPEEKVVALFKTQTRNYASESGNHQLIAGVNALLDGYTTEEHFDFYIQGDVLYLCYIPDSFGPKSMGTTIVECPIQ